MKPRKVYLAALRREIAPLVRHLPKIAGGRVELWGNEQCMVGYGGMGPAAATRAFQTVLALGPVASLASIGWAGSCQEEIAIGQVLRPSTVIDSRTGERFATASGDGGVVVTLDHFAGLEEKHRLKQAYAADCVEMEAATLARLSEAHGIPFYCIKSISDTPDFELQGIASFHTADGGFREGAFAWFAALRPWLWPAVMKMARGSKLAMQRLCAEVERELKAIG